MATESLVTDPDGKAYPANISQLLPLVNLHVHTKITNPSQYYHVCGLLVEHSSRSGQPTVLDLDDSANEAFSDQSYSNNNGRQSEPYRCKCEERGLQIDVLGGEIRCKSHRRL